jgi:hypothetical protein
VKCCFVWERTQLEAYEKVLIGIIGPEENVAGG